MIRHPQANGFGGQHDGAGDYFVMFGRLRLAVRMIVGEEQRRRLVANGGFHDPPGIHGYPVDGAFLQDFHAVGEEAVSGIQIGNREHFVSEAADSHPPKVAYFLRFEQDVGVLRGVLQVQVGRLPDDFHGDRGRFAQTGGLQFGGGGVQNVAQAAEAPEEVAGGRPVVGGGGGQVQQQFDHFVVGEPRQAGFAKPPAERVAIVEGTRRIRPEEGFVLRTQCGRGHGRWRVASSVLMLSTFNMPNFSPCDKGYVFPISGTVGIP